MTANINSTSTLTQATQINNNGKIVTSWTSRFQNLTLAEKRSKLQRGNSIQSNDSTFDCGGGESDDPDRPFAHPIISIVNKKSSTILANGTNKKCRPVLPPPEVSTMMSQMNPEKKQEQNIQQEIDKVAAILKEFQTRTDSITSGLSTDSNDSAVENEFPPNIFENNNRANCTSAVDENKGTKEQRTLSMLNSQTTQSAFSAPISIITQTVESNRNDAVDAHGVRVANSKNWTCANVSESRPHGTRSDGEKEGRRRPLLKKAVSISCEKELSQSAGPVILGQQRSSSSHVRSSSSRLKSARVGFSQSRSTSLTSVHSGSARNGLDRKSSNEDQRKLDNKSPCQLNNSNSVTQNNRKILIKKALIEINQSSIRLRKKWGVLGRPKTASGALSDVSDKKVSPSVPTKGRRAPFKV